MEAGKCADKTPPPFGGHLTMKKKSILDWFIRHDLPIVSMQQRDVTLQEIYESHLEAAYVG